jgi:Raf kinase inhibitor-like YbhB/YbcL family protein
VPGFLVRPRRVAAIRGQRQRAALEELSMVPLKVTSAAFDDKGRIPAKFTADGANISPPLAWSNIPRSAKSLALILEDPDAPRGEPWVHWLIYQIPASVQSLPEGIAPRPMLQTPVSALQGANTWGHTGYGGPQPPKGRPHQYHFRLFALDTQLEITAGLTRQELMAAIKDHVIGTGEAIGIYERS